MLFLQARQPLQKKRATLQRQMRNSWYPCLCSRDSECDNDMQCCDKKKCISSWSYFSCCYDFECDNDEQCCDSHANASVVRLFALSVQKFISETSERIVAGECVCRTVVGTTVLLHALSSAQLSSLPSSSPSYHASAVLAARSTAIVHPVLCMVVTGQQPQQEVVSTQMKTAQQVHLPSPVNPNQVLHLVTFSLLLRLL